MGGEAVTRVPFGFGRRTPVVTRLPGLLLLLFLCLLSTAPATAQSPGASDAGRVAGDESADEIHPKDRKSLDDVIPFNLKPYRVRVEVSLTGTDRGRSVNAATVRRELRRALHRMYGRLWELDLGKSDWLIPGTVAQIADLQKTDLIDMRNEEDPLIRYPETEVDKTMLVAVAATSAGFEIICREYDVRTQDLAPARRAFTPDARGIASESARLIRDSFRSYLKFLRRYEDDSGVAFMELQVQGGEIVVPDPSAEQLRENDVLRPFQRFMSRTDGARLRQLRSLPFTYIRVLSIDREVRRGVATGAVLMHGPVTPFGMRGRSLEQVALCQRPTADSSVVKLIQRSAEERPLVSQRVTLVYKLRLRDEETREQERLVSDRNGHLRIPLTADHPTVWMYIYSGRLLLARIPYAPGILPVDTVTLPDDSIRLSVEGDLQLFRDQLVDAVALREVHFSLARQAADEGRAEDLQQHLEDYAKIPQVESFRKSLALIRVEAVNRAVEERNLPAQRAVERLCRGMEQSLDVFFSDEKRIDREEELSTLKARVGLPAAASADEG